jgi:hypothetical protein
VTPKASNELLGGNPHYADCTPGIPAWFNLSIFAGDKSWVAGVELATASEPPAQKPRIWGCRPAGVDASHPPRCNLLLNLAGFPGGGFWLLGQII